MPSSNRSNINRTNAAVNKKHTCTTMPMNKWANEDFLSSLGGSDEDRSQEKEKYEEFKETREAFDKRQMERMNTPSGRKYMRDMMKKQQQLPTMRKDVDSAGDFFANMRMDGDGKAGGEEGASRFASMMNQAASRKGGRPGMMTPSGFEQKLAISLDDDDIEDDGEE